ncbi:MAG TPA: Gfo/Idh/MocA family oxidoreductase [Firmicutes bacterium]|nr:Gfo/Idh/MocA family oxidoreductase [Bacillota bacterium]
MTEVRFGLVGLGNIGKLHYRYFPNLEGAVLTAVCDIDPARFEALDKNTADFDHAVTTTTKEHKGKIERFRDYIEMLDSGLVDAVIIGVPHIFHPEMCIAAFERGIHVICEKPVAITAREARLINEAYAKSSNVVFAAMFQQRTKPCFIKIKELLNNGTLGEVRRINWIITDWFRTQHYYNSGEWRGNWNGEGGGVLMNQCPHNLDLFQWFFGLPEELYALGYLGKWHDITVEDDISVLMKMSNGATASFITSTADFPGTNRLEITAEKGKLVFEDNKLMFWPLEETVQSIIDTSNQGFYSKKVSMEEIPIEDNPHGHQYITQNVVNTILGKEELIAPGVEGIKSVELANAMLYSMVRQKPVKFPVPEEEFDALLEELRADERKNKPEKAFIWEDYLAQLR